MADEPGPILEPAPVDGPPSVVWRPIAVVGLFVVVAAAIGFISWRSTDDVSSEQAASATAAEDVHSTGSHDHASDDTAHHDDTMDHETDHAGDHDPAEAAHTGHGPSSATDDHGHDGATSPEHEDGHDHAPDPAHAADTHSDGGHHHAECTAPVTAAQQQAADEIAARTQASIAPYAQLATAKAAGWTNITPEGRPIVHYALWDRVTDGRVLDPSAPESMVYGFAPNGTPYLLGAMFLMEGSGTPPQPGGCLMQWHAHENLCIEPGKGMVGVVGPDGECPPGSTNVVTNTMLHAWIVPVPGGPFSDPTPEQLRAAVIEHYLS